MSRKPSHDMRLFVCDCKITTIIPFTQYTEIMIVAIVRFLALTTNNYDSTYKWLAVESSFVCDTEK